MTGARERAEIRMRRLLEDCTLVDQPPQPARPLMIELVEVVGAHLVDRQDDDESRAIRLGAARGRREQECPEKRQEDPGSMWCHGVTTRPVGVLPLA
jgi:hypothetical protein